MDAYIAGATLSDRATSAFPLSIGTSLAFESVFKPYQAPYDPKRTIPNSVDVRNYTSCWVNVTTLFRNLSSAVTKDGFLNASVESLVSTLEEEIGVIQGLFESESNGMCKPEFYFSDYSSLERRHTVGLELRKPTTNSQHFYHSRLIETLRKLDKRSDIYHAFDDSLKPNHKEVAFVLTHQPYDLVDFQRFTRLDLLESNTGILKPKSMWASKFYPMSGLSFVHLPFFKKLLLVFGDKSLIKPTPLPLRKQVYETSIKRQWSAVTTLAKVKFDVDLDLTDPYSKAVFDAL